MGGGAASSGDFGLKAQAPGRGAYFFHAPVAGQHFFDHRDQASALHLIHVAFDGAAVTALNPKGIVFFVAFLPQFTTPGGPMALQLWVLAATFVCMAIINATLYALFAAKTRRLLASPRAQRRFNVVGGTLLFAAGVWALLARRVG